MLISAKIFQNDRMWLAECESFCIMTQGESKAEAFSMLGDAIRSLYPDFDFDLKWLVESEGVASIEPKSIAVALGIMIERNRNDNGLTLVEFANLVGSKNHNSIYAYEKAAREASFSKVEELMQALSKKLLITLAD